MSLAPFHSAGAAACTTAGTDALTATWRLPTERRDTGRSPRATEFGSGGAIALEELRGLADTVTLVRDGVGGKRRRRNPSRILFGARRASSRGGGGRRGGHANRDESATLSDGLKMRHERCSCADAGAVGHCLFSDGTRSRSVSTLRKLLRFMAGKSIRRLAWFRVADWPNRQKYQQFWQVKPWGSIQINFRRQKDRRTTKPRNLFATFRGKSRAGRQCTRQRERRSW